MLDHTPRKTIEELATIDADGIVRWKSNNHVPFDDMLEGAIDEGLSEIDLAACQAAREADTQAFLAAYCANHSGPPSDEERFEARAAFGPGEEVVNALSGRRFIT